MRLIRLSANKKSFKTIDFKPGLNIILAKRFNEDDRDMEKTYNGVGKSLSLYLVHFCLASKLNKKTGNVQDVLKDWEFELEFEINGENFSATRAINTPNIVTVNEKDLSLTEYKKLLGQKVFSITQTELSFRSLISRFMRARKESYLRFDKYVLKETDEKKLLHTSYLLGIEIQPVIEKAKLKKELDRIVNLKNDLEKDPTIKQVLQADSQDVRIEIIDTREKIEALERKISTLQVAEDYQEVQREADQLHTETTLLKNQSMLLFQDITNINETLKLFSNLKTKDVNSIYSKIKVEFNENIKKQIGDVQEFYKKISTNRLDRLSKDLKKLNLQKDDVVAQLEKKTRELDAILAYLKTHAALDEYITVTQKLNSLKLKLAKMETYQKVIGEFEEQKNTIIAKMAEANIVAAKYISNDTQIDTMNSDFFRVLSRRFYEKAGGIKLENNDGENKVRYNLSVSLEDDSSDGINNVKIFCFDMTLLLAQQNHNVKFIFHDSRLFSNMDPRQVETSFKQAYERCNDNFQYIVSINENQINGELKENMNPEEYTKIFEANKVLTLTDESDKSKLLGIHVNLKYED